MAATEEIEKEILAEMAANPVPYAAGQVNDVITIDGETRMISVPASEIFFGVESDKDVERKHFRCPKVVGDGIDLSKHQIYISYITSDSAGKTFSGNAGLYLCEDVATDGDDITFSWQLSGNVFASAGFIAFKVLAAKTDGENVQTRWNTVPAIGTVLMTVPDGMDIGEAYPDIVTQLLERMASVEKIATEEAMQGYVNTYLEAHPGEIDETLTDPKKAAPASVVGELKEDLDELENYIYDVKNGEVHDGYGIYLNDGKPQLSNIGDGYSLNTYEIEKDKRYIIKTNSSIFRIGFNKSGFVDNYFLINYQQLDGNSVYEFTATGEYNYIHVFFKSPNTPNAQVNVFEASKNTLPNIESKIDEIRSDVDNLENCIYDVKNGEVHDGYGIYLNDGKPQLSNIGDGYSLNTYNIEKDKRYIIKTNSSIFRIAYNNSGFVANYFLNDYQQLDGNSVYEFTSNGEYSYIHVFFKTPNTPNAQVNVFDVPKNTLPNIESKIDEIENDSANLKSAIDEIKIMNIDDICDFEIGNINTSTGAKIDSTIRMRSSRKIRLNKGDIIKSNIYGMVVICYDREGNFIGISYTEYQTWTRIFEMKSDYDVIIVCRKDSNDSTIKTYDLVRAKNSIYISRLNKTMSSYISSSIAYSKALDGMASLMNTNNDISVNLYQKLGKLTKSGKNIIDSNGNNVVLTGIGTHSISEYNSLYTEEVMKTLTYYGLNCIRISVYLTDKQFQNSDGRTGLGWLNNSDTLKPIIEELIDVATNAGLYIILDWHSYHTIDGGDVTQYKPQQEAFFEYFSNKYSNQDNILYELHNEPYRNTASELLDSVISCANIIRNHNPDAILICGEGNDGVVTMDDLFNKTNNLDIFISPHLYTGEQTIDYIRDRIRENRPIFVTEWGNSSLSGDDLPNDNEALKMFNLCHSNNISYCLWKMTYQE